MDIPKIQDYLSGKLSAQDSLEVQLFLAEHMDDPEVTRLMDSYFDSCRREAGKNTQGALDSVHKRLGLTDTLSAGLITGWQPRPPSFSLPSLQLSRQAGSSTASRLP